MLYLIYYEQTDVINDYNLENNLDIFAVSETWISFNFSDIIIHKIANDKILNYLTNSLLYIAKVVEKAFMKQLSSCMTFTLPQSLHKTLAEHQYHHPQNSECHSPFF